MICPSCCLRLLLDLVHCLPRLKPTHHLHFCFCTTCMYPSSVPRFQLSTTSSAMFSRNAPVADISLTDPRHGFCICQLGQSLGRPHDWGGGEGITAPAPTSASISADFIETVSSDGWASFANPNCACGCGCGDRMSETGLNGQRTGGGACGAFVLAAPCSWGCVSDQSMVRAVAVHSDSVRRPCAAQQCRRWVQRR